MSFQFPFIVLLVLGFTRNNGVVGFFAPPPTSVMVSPRPVPRSTSMILLRESSLDNGNTYSMLNNDPTSAHDALQETVSPSPEAAAEASTATATALSPPEDVLLLWQRRLITFEDPFSIHKLSSITYSLSALVILGTGFIQWLQSPETWSTIPSSLLVPSYIFAGSNIIMCVVSVRMAFDHRRYDLTARNGFLGVASSSMFSGFYFLWTNPLGPAVFDNQLVTQACFAIFVLLDVFFVVDTLVGIGKPMTIKVDFSWIL